MKVKLRWLHYEVSLPAGYKQVLDGKTKKGDKYWSLDNNKFKDMRSDALNNRIQTFCCIIRKVNSHSHPHTALFR